MSKSIHDDELLNEHGEELPTGFSKQTLTIIVVTLVVLGSVGAALLFFTIDQGSVLGIDITNPSANGEVLTFAYTIRTERAAASGTATLTVLLNGTLQLSRAIEVTDGGGRLDVKLGDFAVGNGVYNFRLDFKDSRGQVNYEIGIPDETNFIVTAVRAEAKNQTWVGPDLRRGAIRYTAYFYSDVDAGIQTKAPPGSALTLRLLKNGISPDPLFPPLVLATEGRTFVDRYINVSLGPGNYSVEATFLNQWVKTGSAIKTMAETDSTFIHDKPRACLVLPPSGEYHGNNANSFTITADASCSTDDIIIVQYTWDFGDGSPPVTNNATPTEGHTFPASTFTQRYPGVVEAIDNYGEWDYAYFNTTTSSN